MLSFVKYYVLIFCKKKLKIFINIPKICCILLLTFLKMRLRNILLSCSFLALKQWDQFLVILISLYNKDRAQFKIVNCKTLYIKNYNNQFRIKKMMNKERQHRRVWSQQQDDTLRIYVEQSQDITKPKWKEISQKLNNTLELEFKRNPKQCRQRWYNSLAPNSQQTKQWTVQDDVALIQACKKYGHRWSRLAKQFDQSVNDNRLKNHFYSTVRKIVRVINTLVKQSKKQYQQNQKNGLLDTYSQHQTYIIKQIMKLRIFEPKLLSKVFSLIDSKQEYKYQAKQSLEVESVKNINEEVLDYMEDFVTERNQFSKWKILEIVVKVMHVNRTITTKYIRQIKLSLQDESEIQKNQEMKKKRQRKINNIVKEQLDNKIIPDRKTKAEIIKKIGQQNKKLRRLIKPASARRIKHRRSIKQGFEGQDLQIIDGQIMMDENQQLINQSASNTPGGTKKPRSRKSKNSKTQNNNMQIPSIAHLVVQGVPENSLKNSSGIEPNNQNSQNNHQNSSSGNNSSSNNKYSSPASFNVSSIINMNVPKQDFSFNNMSINFDQAQRARKDTENVSKYFKINQSILHNIRPNQFSGVLRQKDQNSQNNQKDNPFASNFLNDIPLLTSNAPKKVEVDIKELINPFFPEHKLTHSQGYFSFDPPNQENIERVENDLYKSNPILNSLQMEPPRSIQEHGVFQGFNEVTTNPALRNSKVFEGLFASYNYQSNDKASQHSQRMRSSLFDLIPNLQPTHTSAFNPLAFGNNRQIQHEVMRENHNLLDVSRPFSTHFNDHHGGRFNMLQSQPIGVGLEMYRSSDLHADSNQSGNNLYHSYSFGQMSQENKSNHSKKKR